MNKKTKFSIEEIYYSLCELDLKCSNYDILEPKCNKIISFYNDENPIYLEIKFTSEYAKIHRGYSITKEEKKIVFPYCDYDSVDDYTDYLAEFVIKYFKSFKYVRTTD